MGLPSARSRRDAIPAPDLTGWVRLPPSPFQFNTAQIVAPVHEEYRTDPVGWAIDKLGIRRETLVWSENPGYDQHTWDGDADPLVRIFEALRDWKDAGGESGTGCLAGDSELIINRGGNSRRFRIDDVVAKFNGERVRGQRKYWDRRIPTYVQREVDGVMRLGRLVNAWRSGVKTTYEVRTVGGRSIRATDEHPFLTERGWLRLDELRLGDLLHVRGEQASAEPRQAKKNYRMVSGLIGHPYAGRRDAARHAYRYPLHRLVVEAAASEVPLLDLIACLRDGDGVDLGFTFYDPAVTAVHHLDRDVHNNALSNLCLTTHREHHQIHAEEGTANAVLYKVDFDPVVRITRFGKEETYDIEVADAPHNFVANGIVVHNTGKSFGASVLTLWFLACWENALVFTFAPKEDQLRLFIWRNITDLWPAFSVHFPQATMKDLTLRMRGGLDESWAAHGYAVGVKAGEPISTKASGMHAEHMLLIYEEMPGIAPAVIQAGENTCTAPHNLRLGIGNPNHRLDPLHLFCESPGVVHVRISALDHPNVVAEDASIIPGAASASSIAKRLEKYGVESPIYQSRVRGVSPDQASDGLIRRRWLEDAAARYLARVQAGTVPQEITGKGVDVANSEHGDRACIVDFAGNVVVRVDAFPCPDANVLGRKITLEVQAADLLPMRVGVDAIGVGAGTVNEARRLGIRVNALNASAPAMGMVEKLPDGGRLEWGGDVNQFKNLRSQMYWQLREDFRTGVIDMERDDGLWEELLTPTFADEPKTVVEAKDEIRARLGRSPDKADALAMGNWVRSRALDRKVAPRTDAQVGISPGYDYTHQKVRERETGDRALERLLGVGQKISPIANRYGRPRHG